MQIITTNDIFDVLEKNYEKLLNGDEPENILFLGSEGYGRSSVIRKWANHHEKDFVLYFMGYPGPLHEEKNGVLIRQVPEQYVYADNQFNENEKRVFFYQRLNWGRSTTGDEELIKVLRDPEYSTLFKTYNMKNRLFTVATAFSEDSGNTLLELSPELLSLFKCYLVKPDFRQTLLHLKEEYEDKIKFFEEENDIKWVDKEKTRLAIIEELLNLQGDIIFNNEFTPAKLAMVLSSANSTDHFVKKIESQLAKNEQNKLIIDTIKQHLNKKD